MRLRQYPFPFRPALAVMLASILVLPGARAEQRTIEDCVIEPNSVAEVSSPVNGIVDRVSIERGDLVKKGQVLANLESRIEKATVELARVRSERDQAIKAKRARLEFTQRRLKRNQDLLAQNLISEQVVDEAETDALLAELELGEFLEERMIAILELERAEAALDIRNIRSPFSGVVVEVMTASGESVENRPLVKIASIDPLNVEVIAPVELFGKIKKGMKAKVLPEQPIGGEYSARVDIVDRVLDAASGTFGIRLKLPNRKYRLPAGLRCKVTFDDLELSRQDTGEAATDAIAPAGLAEESQGGTSEAGDDYVYTVYLFSTRSADIAGQVNEKFRNQGLATEILQSSGDTITRYRVAVTGFRDLNTAKKYSDSLAGSLDIGRPWIGKNPFPE